MAGRLDGWTAGWLDGWTAGWLDGWMARLLDGWTAGWLDGWMARLLDGWTAGWLDGWTAGRLDGWTAGRLDGWTAGRLEGWTAGHKSPVRTNLNTNLVTCTRGSCTPTLNSLVGSFFYTHLICNFPCKRSCTLVLCLYTYKMTKLWRMMRNLSSIFWVA
jgi:hypothetical protein